MLFRKSEFILEDIDKMNKKNPRTFMKPSLSELDELKPGSSVKLIFRMTNKLDNGCSAERMWVTVSKVEHESITGILDNEPYFLKTIKCGDEVIFHRSNIASISREGHPCYDESKFAIITQKALEHKQINWVVRTDDLSNEQDSGWQLFYGDENEIYLDNPTNSTLISLGRVLDFEPLLESVFSQNGWAYEYQARSNKFIEIEKYIPN